MKVSVSVITYNQEEFIAQAIDSILRQEVSFDYEIVIGEDVSTDRTREIVLELQKRYPDKIRVVMRDAVDSERDRARGLGGKKNFVKTLEECRGEYVALLDGDDYWTDSRKLQKQVDFLERHPECSLCFHNAEMFYDDGSQPSINLRPADQKEVSTLEDILAGMVPIPCTVLFRNNLLGELPDSFDTVANGDWMLFVLLAEHGSVGYLNEVMAAYRMHAGGTWSKLNRQQRLKEHINTYETINEHLKFKYDRAISKIIAALPRRHNEQHARSCLDQYHRLVKKGEIKKGLPLLLEATHAAPLEVLRPRRFLSVLKNGILGLTYKESAHGTESESRL
jgi:glycosyltransferase involved in cell wall biosynthesis